MGLPMPNEASQGAVGGAATGLPPTAGGQATSSFGSLPISLTGNGERQRLDLDTRVTLLDALREHLHLTGTIRRMLAVIDSGRVLNPLTARSQVIGAMTMGVGAALMEALAVDTRHGFFINHDLGGYEVPVHADIPHLDVVFLDHPDPVPSPIKDKGIGEIGLCGAAAAVANAVYNATGIRVRDYPLTLDKLLDRLPRAA